MKMAVVAAVAAGALVQIGQASPLGVDALRTARADFYGGVPSTLISGVAPQADVLVVPDGGSTVLMVGLALVIAAIFFRRRLGVAVARKPGPPVSETADR